MKREGKREMINVSPWSGVLTGVLVGVVTALLSLVVWAILIATAAVPEWGEKVGALLSVALGTMIGVLAARKKFKGRNTLMGALVGGLMAALFAATGLLLYGGIEVRRCAAVLSTCLCVGGFVGMVGRGKTRRRTR